MGYGAPLVGHGSSKGKLRRFSGNRPERGRRAPAIWPPRPPKPRQPLRGARTVLLVVLIAVVPVVFDPHTGDVFNIPKYAVVVDRGVGARGLVGAWRACTTGPSLPGATACNGSSPPWWSGPLFPLSTGVDVHVGLLGNYGSYDGLFSAACFGVVAMTAAEAFDGDGVRRALGTFAFCGGAVVVVYGLIQLHDVEVSGPKWDFITWKSGSFAQDFFSTFGNPNHLGGYLAMLLPAVLVLGLGTKHWAWRASLGVVRAGRSHRAAQDFGTRRLAWGHSGAGGVGRGAGSRAQAPGAVDGWRRHRRCR